MIIQELCNYLNSQDIKARVIDEKSIRIDYDTLPIYLLVELRDGKYLYISIRYEDHLRDVLEDLHEGGENIEDVVEEALSYLSEISLRIRKWSEPRGLITVFKLKEGSVELLDMVEELKQELGE
ncbi:MAG: hypothetical protein QW254_01185 [Desulfurococcaceae archaeon]